MKMILAKFLKYGFEFFIFMLFLGLPCNHALALPDIVRVNLFEARASVPFVRLKGSANLERPHARNLGSDDSQIIIEGQRNIVALYVVSGEKRKLLFKSKMVVLSERSLRGVALQFPGRDSLIYRGEILVKSKNSCLSVINNVNVRDFVYGVVASELPVGFHPEAKKALAVLTLTRLEFLPDGKAIGDSTKSELYSGATHVTQRVKDVIDSVWNKRLYYQGKLVLPYYHSTCAGSTSAGNDLFNDRSKTLNYLSSVDCSHCKESPFFSFKRSLVKTSEITSVFGGALPVVLKRDDSKRPVIIGAKSKGKPLSGYRAWILLGRALGWGKIPGTRYYLRSVENSNPPQVEVRSSGAGHGIGLCQWGANGLANQGETYQNILEQYFPLCKIK